MRIAHLHLGDEFAGSETYAASLAALQAAAGHTVAVVVRQGPNLRRWREVAPEAAVLVIPRWAVGPLERWVVRRYLTGFAPAVLHSHLGGAHRLGAWLAPRLKIPHVGTLHLRYKPKEHAACDGLVAIAQWQVQEIPASYRGRLAVVWNWLPQRATLPPRVRRPTPLFCFGSVGRLHPQKGMITLVQAFKQAFPDDQTVRLALVGEGPERPTLEALIGDDARITLHGYQAEVAAFYHRWDAYVSAAKHEPFGLTLLEAMAAGLPLVCTRTEGPGEFLPGQPTAPFWAEREDVASLAAALQRCRQAGQQPVVWDLTPFDGARAVTQIELLYKELGA
jgi:glycosyltransferase involved in cell wall biosynthesis